MSQSLPSVARNKSTKTTPTLAAIVAMAAVVIVRFQPMLLGKY
jgi:hypothetical protein